LVFREKTAQEKRGLPEFRSVVKFDGERSHESDPKGRGGEKFKKRLGGGSRVRRKVGSRRKLTSRKGGRKGRKMRTHLKKKSGCHQIYDLTAEKNRSEVLERRNPLHVASSNPLGKKLSEGTRGGGGPTLDQRREVHLLKKQKHRSTKGKKVQTGRQKKGSLKGPF